MCGGAGAASGCERKLGGEGRALCPRGFLYGGAGRGRAGRCGTGLRTEGLWGRVGPGQGNGADGSAAPGGALTPPPPRPGARSCSPTPMKLRDAPSACPSLWRCLPCPPAELRLDLVLSSGQSFR